MSSNTIGQGAVVLTASADQLLVGLDRAHKATQKFAANTAKAASPKSMGGGGKGLLAGFLFGTGAGAALAAVGAAVSAFSALASKLSNVNDLAQKYGNIPVDRTMRLDGIQKSFDRIEAASDDFLMRVGERLAPVFKVFADVIERVGFVGSEVFDVLSDEISGIVTQVSEWIDATFGAQTATATAGKTTMDALRWIGKGFAYLVDAVKWFAGQALKGFALVVDGAAHLLRGLGADEWAGEASKIADGMRLLGGGWIDSFGASADKVDAWFNRIEAKFEDTQRIAKATGVALAGAMGRGTADAYSVLAKFQAANILTGQSSPDDPKKIAKEQLNQQKIANRHLMAVGNALANPNIVVKVVP